MVSNPFGFEGQQYLMGAAVELALPLSVLAAGYKLNITAVTVHDQLQIGFLAMPEAVPDIDKLARATEQRLRRDEGRAGSRPPLAATAAPLRTRTAATKAAGARKHASTRRKATHRRPETPTQATTTKENSR